MNSQKVVIAEDLGQSLKEAIEACERDKVFMLMDETTCMGRTGNRRRHPSLLINKYRWWHGD